MSASTSSIAKCPVTGATGPYPPGHEFIAPREGDSRAPCPAMNTMANHGYLPRDGQCINAGVIVAALMACYKLSKPLAWFLTHGALALLDQGSGDFCLHDLARHNKIEHNASLYHDDAGPREEYAPIHGSPALLAAMWADSDSGVVMTPEDVARVRVRREATSHPPLDFIHAELAKGEMAIVLNMFNNPDPALHAEGIPLLKRNILSRAVRRVLGKTDAPTARPLDGVPIARMREWFEHERLPEGWAPYHKTTLRSVVATNNRMRFAMRRMRKAQKTSTSPTPTPDPIPVAAEEKLAAPVAQTEEEEASVEAEDANTLTMRPGHLDRSASSTATDSSFPESVLHTPSTSEFEPARPAVFYPKRDAVLPRLQAISDKWGVEEVFEVERSVVVAA